MSKCAQLPPTEAIQRSRLLKELPVYPQDVNASHSFKLFEGIELLGGRIVIEEEGGW
jgi:hypothetical protein